MRDLLTYRAFFSFFFMVFYKGLRMVNKITDKVKINVMRIDRAKREKKIIWEEE